MRVCQTLSTHKRAADSSEKHGRLPRDGESVLVDREQEGSVHIGVSADGPRRDLATADELILLSDNTCSFMPEICLFSLILAPRHPSRRIPIHTIAVQYRTLFPLQPIFVNQYLPNCFNIASVSVFYQRTVGVRAGLAS